MYTAHLILFHFAGIEIFYKLKVYGYPTSRASLCLVFQSCSILCDPTDCSPPGSSVYRDYPGKDTGVGCHALLQGLFPTQGLNPGLPHCRRILYCLSHQGSPSHVYVYMYLYIYTYIYTYRYICIYMSFTGGSDVKESACNAGDMGLIPWRRKWQPTPVYLLGESHGQARTLEWAAFPFSRVSSQPRG